MQAHSHETNAARRCAAHVQSAVEMQDRIPCGGRTDHAGLSSCSRLPRVCRVTLVVMKGSLAMRRHELKFKLWAVSMAMTLHPGCFLDCLSSPKCDWCRSRGNFESHPIGPSLINSQGPDYPHPEIEMMRDVPKTECFGKPVWLREEAVAVSVQFFNICSFLCLGDDCHRRQNKRTPGPIRLARPRYSFRK